MDRITSTENKNVGVTNILIRKQISKSGMKTSQLFISSLCKGKCTSRTQRELDVEIERTLEKHKKNGASQDSCG